LAKKTNKTTRAAVIGLIGTILTVCGGLLGAVISGVTTIYQVERRAQQIALAAPGSDQALNIDAGSILISRQQAATLDPETYFVDLDHGLAIHRPLADWDALEEVTLEEQLAEAGVVEPAPLLVDQPVYRIRYGEPIEIQYDRKTLVNGQALPEERLQILEQLYGPPPWTQLYYSQVIINIFERDVAEELGIESMPDLLLLLVHFAGNRTNRLVAEEGGGSMVVQSSGTYDRVRVEGEEAALTLETWLLVTVTDTAYYTVEISYTPQSGQSVQVWDDLQTYMDSFRVIE
jgi:hypothetical protein